MSFSPVTYAVSKHYTDETAIQFGGLKGASCKIKSIIKKDGQNIITFEWKNDEGEIRESTIYVEDGTPIYNWTSGDTYKYGDLVIYTSCFYRCIYPNSDIVFDDTKWNEIGNPDGNYDIVQSSSLLPPRFTAADRKLYYSIEDQLFYLWNGTEWIRQNKIVQYTVLPTPIRVFANRIVQYIGETNSNYNYGYFYSCEEIGSRYVWKNIDVQQTSTVAKTGEYNDLINRPITYLIGEGQPIILTNLSDGFYTVVGSYCFYEGGTTYIATSKEYFIIESSSGIYYITEIRGNKIKYYTYSIDEGLAETQYASIDDVESILDTEFKTRTDDYISHNIATAQQIETLFE